MSSTVLRLRPWQRHALERFRHHQESDFLAVATPGAGKTTFAVTAARLTLPRLPGRLVVVAPTRHLKYQWALAAERVGLVLEPDWKPADGLPADVHGLVTTYQQVATAATELASIARDGFVVLDEIHHAGDDRAWGAGISRAFGWSAHRLALSGTPFRSDDALIPFLDYQGDEVVPDVEYGYGDALGDGRVVRPVYFPRFGGHMEWTAPDGAVLSASFDDPLPRSLANQRLRAALHPEGDWLPTVLGEADTQLRRIRERDPRAGGLVITIDTDHAAEIAKLMRRRCGIEPVVVTSEDPDASRKIDRFADGDEPWVVAVRMISEGVDIPRLRVGVYATTTSTELFFRQAIGRIVRYTGGRGKAFMYIPDDPRLRFFASCIAETRRHRIKAANESEVERAEPTEGADEQMSLFEVLSATITDATHDDQTHAALADAHDDTDEPGLPDPDLIPPDHDDGLLIDLTALPPLAETPLASGAVPTRAERERLRRLNTGLVKSIAAATGLTHAQVNAELNRLSGVTRVAEATAAELERRARLARRWHDRELGIGVRS